MKAAASALGSLDNSRTWNERASDHITFFEQIGNKDFLKSFVGLLN